MTWQLFAFGAAIFAALTTIFGKLGVSELNSNLATFIRTVIILILTALVVSLKNDWIRPAQLSQKGLLFLILSGVATGLSWLCFYKALELGPASRVASIDKLSVAFVAILSILFLGEPFTWKLAAGIFLLVSGVLVLTVA